MPPVDRSEMPALRLATLADRKGGTFRLLDIPEPWDVPLSNGERGRLMVRARTDLPDGRRIADGDYYAGGSTWTGDSFWFDRERMTRCW